MKQCIGYSDSKPIFIDINETWSFKNFSNQKHIFEGHAKELVGINIYKSNFYQEGIPDQDVFPSDIQNLTLYHCNLDNVRIPNGVKIIDCSTKRIQIQNDLRDWELDENNLPIKVCNEKAEKMRGYSIDPLDIPKASLKDISELLKTPEAFLAQLVEAPRSDKELLEAAILKVGGRDELINWIKDNLNQSTVNNIVKG